MEFGIEKSKSKSEIDIRFLLPFLLVLPGFFADLKAQEVDIPLYLGGRNKTEFSRSELEGSSAKMKEVSLRLVREKLKADFDLNNEIEIFTKIQAHIKLAKSKRDSILLSGGDISLIDEELEGYDTVSGSVKDRIEMLRNLATPDTSLLVEEKIKEINRMNLFYDLGRAWVLESMNKPKFKERLRAEYVEDFINEEDLKRYIEEKLIEMRAQVSDTDFILSTNMKQSFRLRSGIDGYRSGFYNLNRNKVFLALDNPMLDSDSLAVLKTALHEYAHSLRKAYKNMSKKSVSILSSAVDSDSVSAYFLEEFDGDSLKAFNFFSNPYELYAMKKVFEYDLERFEIKRYEEDFTLLHYLKARKLLEEGLLNQDSAIILKIVRFEGLREIMKLP